MNATHHFHFMATVAILAFMNISAAAQESTLVQGHVVAKETRKPIIDANVEVLGAAVGDVTDSSGYFQIKLNPGTYVLKASRIGFEPRQNTVILQSGASPNIEFVLKPVLVNLRQVEVEAERLSDKNLTKASLIGVERMHAREITNVPGSLDDPTRAVQIFSGVSGGGDYSGFLAVRGGTPDQNQVVVDGALLPYPYRFRLAFGAGFSAINPYTTEDIYLHLGGFSAEYGNALSSILEVESKSGNRDRVRTQAALNFMEVNGVIDGPLPGGIGTFLISGRRTYYDAIVNKISDSHSVFPFFYDFSTKLEFDINPTNRITVNVTHSKEGSDLLGEVAYDLDLTEKSTSNLINLSWKKLVGSKWRFSSLFAYYADSTSYEARTSLLGSQFFRTIEKLNARESHLSFKEDIRYQMAAQTWLNCGFYAEKIPSAIDLTSGNFEYTYARFEAPANVQFKRTYRYYATYLETSSKVTESLHLRAGLRYDYSTFINEGALSPRLSIWYKLNDRTNLEGSFGLFYQYPNPMALHTRNVPVDLSQNVQSLSAEKAVHLIYGIKRLIGSDYSIKLQIYNKDLDRLLLPRDEVNYAPANTGRGFSRGFEVILQKKPSPRSRVSGIVTYAYNDAKFRDLDSEDWLPSKFSRPHALTILYNMKIVGNWNISLLGQYASGLPFTDVVGLRSLVYDEDKVEWYLVKGDRFGARFPAYKRVDFRLSYQPRLKDRALSFYLDIINLTNEKNIYEVFWGTGDDEYHRDFAVKRTIYMLPLIPSFGLSFRF